MAPSTKRPHALGEASSSSSSSDSDEHEREQERVDDKALVDLEEALRANADTETLLSLLLPLAELHEAIVGGRVADSARRMYAAVVQLVRLGVERRSALLLAHCEALLHICTKRCKLECAAADVAPALGVCSPPFVITEFTTAAISVVACVTPQTDEQYAWACAVLPPMIDAMLAFPSQLVMNLLMRAVARLLKNARLYMRARKMDATMPCDPARLANAIVACIRLLDHGEHSVHGLFALMESMKAIGSAWGTEWCGNEMCGRFAAFAATMCMELTTSRFKASAVRTYNLYRLSTWRPMADASRSQGGLMQLLQCVLRSQ